MPETFEILAGFLERFGAEVEGRELEEPSEETKSKLQQLARGELSEPERVNLFGLLNQHPQWIGRLAQEVKALRTDKNPG